MRRIDAVFARLSRPAFIGFLVAGDPDKETCIRAAMALIGSIQGLVIQATLSGRVGDIRAGADAAFDIWRKGVSAA